MRRSGRYFLVAVLALTLGSGPVAGHSDANVDGSSWLLWGKVSALALGAGCVAVGLYLDRNRPQRSRYVDYLVVAGFLLGTLGGLSLYD